MEMAKRKTIENQVHNRLKSRIAFGESKHKNKYGFGKSTYKIYSYTTYNTYLKVSMEYISWLIRNKIIHKYEKIENTDRYAEKYLKFREDKVSKYTLKMERSALGMLYGEKVDFAISARDNSIIRRSRKKTENDKHYSEDGKYRDIFIIARATGARRKDLTNLKSESLKEIDGRYYIFFEQSKGGRERVSPIRDEYLEDVKTIFKNARNHNLKKIFDKIPTKIDVHSYRREYAQNLYKDIIKNPQLKAIYLQQYPKRKELKCYKRKDGTKYYQEIKTKTYKDRQGNIYDRDVLYIISQSLGHNRIEVSVTHYVKF